MTKHGDHFTNTQESCPKPYYTVDPENSLLLSRYEQVEWC